MKKESANLDLMTMPLSPETIKAIKARVNPSLIKVNSQVRYGTGEYLDVETYVDLMNSIFGNKWSWEMVTKEIISVEGFTPFVEVLGRLSVPGIGVKEAYGGQPLHAKQKDITNSAKMASSYAFKTACKMCGVGNFEEEIELFDGAEGHDVVEEDPKPRTKTKAASEFSPKSLQRIKAFKEDYEITDNKELSPYIKAWNKELKGAGDLTPENIDNFLDWIDKHGEDIAEGLME